MYLSKHNLKQRLMLDKFAMQFHFILIFLNKYMQFMCVFFVVMKKIICESKLSSIRIVLWHNKQHYN